LKKNCGLFEARGHVLGEKGVVDLHFGGTHGKDGKESRKPLRGDATIWPAEGI
jgi:hypothetical protein